MTAGPLIQFDEATHTYTVNGRRVPGVTSVLKPLYGDLRFVDQDLLDYKSELGKAVHKAIELHCLDGLNYSSLTSPVAEYFEQYLLFEAETGFRPTASEVMVASALGFCGTYDLEGLLNRQLYVIDVKTTAALSPAVALQTIAYLRARNENDGTKAERRAALRLAPDKYRFVPYDTARDAVDFGAFVGLLKAKQWCDAYGSKLSEIK